MSPLLLLPPYSCNVPPLFFLGCVWGSWLNDTPAMQASNLPIHFYGIQNCHCSILFSHPPPTPVHHLSRRYHLYSFFRLVLHLPLMSPPFFYPGNVCPLTSDPPFRFFNPLPGVLTVYIMGMLHVIEAIGGGGAMGIFIFFCEAKACNCSGVLGWKIPPPKQ